MVSRGRKRTHTLIVKSRACCGLALVAKCSEILAHISLFLFQIRSSIYETFHMSLHKLFVFVLCLCCCDGKSHLMKGLERAGLAAVARSETSLTSDEDPFRDNLQTVHQSNNINIAQGCIGRHT